MPQVTGAITVNNGAATPVAKTFSPEMVTSGSSVFVDRVSKAVREQQSAITVKFDRPTKTRKTFRVTHSIAIPIVTIVGGVEVVADIARANVDYILPESTSVDIRKDLVAFTTNVQSNALVKAGPTDLEPLF